MNIKILTLSLAILCMTATAFAQHTPEVTSPVTDLADILLTAEENHISSIILEHQRRTGVQIAVVTVSDLQGNAPEDFAMKIAEEWRGGSEACDDGIVVLLARAERVTRIEVGYGLESALLDSEALSIGETAGQGYFSRGFFYEGIMRIVSDIKNETQDGAECGAVEEKKTNWLLVIFALISLSAVGTALLMLFQRQLHKT